MPAIIAVILAIAAHLSDPSAARVLYQWGEGGVVIERPIQLCRIGGGRCHGEPLFLVNGAPVYDPNDAVRVPYPTIR